MELDAQSGPLIVSLGVMLVGLVGVFVPVMPGVPLIFAGALIYGWLTSFEQLSGGWILLFALLTALSVAVDFLAAAWVTRRMGASRRAAAGALLGTLAGVICFGAYGALLGGVGGAVAGELSLNRSARVALRSGAGAFVGFLFALAADLVFGLAIIGLFLLVAL